MHIFHKWSKWEQYEWNGTIVKLNLRPLKTSPPISVTEKRQRRTCEICGKMQDKEI